MNLEQFSEMFALLAVQLRFTDADEITIRAYYKALGSVEAEFVAMAAQRFASGVTVNEQGEVWFPKAPEWRAMATKIEAERRDELKGILRKRMLAGQLLCLECDDTGWQRVDDGMRRCQCRNLRRLEVLGRRPMPALPAYEPEGEPGQHATALALATKHVKGMA